MRFFNEWIISEDQTCMKVDYTLNKGTRKTTQVLQNID